MPTSKPKKRFPLVAMLIETFGFSPALASVVAVFIGVLSLLALIWVVQSAPPRTLVMTSGPEGSTFHRWAESYQKALAKHGVALEIIPSGGSLDNLRRLRSPDSRVDIGFVAGGLVKDEEVEGLMSLGSVAYQPLWVFYRNGGEIARLSQLTGRRIGVGAAGSGTRELALTLLKSNGIEGAPTTFSELDADAAAEALLKGELDAVFLMGDSASIRTLRALGRAQDVRLYSFTQADAYVRRNAFLNKITLPRGSFDLGQNLPPEDVVLVGPTVEFVAREGLHSALSDLLLEVAGGIHGRAGLLQKRGEFPSLVERDFPISDDAVRYNKSGKGFVYRLVGSFWVASLINRLLVAVVPLVLILIPAMRLLPIVYRMSIQLRLYRCYRPLLRIERETFGSLTEERVATLLTELDEIEVAVKGLKVPASFADRFYWLHSHVSFVRERLKAAHIGNVSK